MNDGHQGDILTTPQVTEVLGDALSDVICDWEPAVKEQNSWTTDVSEITLGYYVKSYYLNVVNVLFEKSGRGVAPKLWKMMRSIQRCAVRHVIFTKSMCSCENNFGNENNTTVALCDMLAIDQAGLTPVADAVFSSTTMDWGTVLNKAKGLSNAVNGKLRSGSALSHYTNVGNNFFPYQSYQLCL